MFAALTLCNCGLTRFSSLVACGIYYSFWIYIIPKLKGYRVRQEVLFLENGAQSHRIIKVPVTDLPEWDRAHDAVGRLRRRQVGGDAKVDEPAGSEDNSEKNGVRV